MANKLEVEIEVNAEIHRIALESRMIIEQFQKLLGVYTTTEALAKIAVLMREDDTADRLLSKCLGHLSTSSEDGAKELHDEIAEAFGSQIPKKKWNGHYETCPANNGGSCTC